MSNDPKLDLRAAVTEHTALFNSCVDSGDWAPFVATFAADARMTVTAMPGGIYDGRASIARMYAARPPTGRMELLDIDPIDDRTVRVRFALPSGRQSTMVVQWRGSTVSAVELTL